ncbi:MAG: alpha/beta fold hydrolase [Wenzhouxiangellaceae bacterium]|nr:MAG: alpha/beta fold hydrolase [Wenzhouxiangellaceae bacterium]
MGRAERQVVLVHGLWYGPVSMALLALRLEAMGYKCHRFGYPTLSQNVAANARALFEFARGIDLEQVDFVGHSLGGIVILRMFDEYRGLPPGRLVLLGSPVRGSDLASHLASVRMIRPLIGQARTALERGFSYSPAGRETGVIAGTKAVGLGRVLGKLDAPSDGTIRVAETRLDDAADTLELPVSHTGLVLSRDVSDAVGRFLSEGRFAPGGAVG